MELLIAIAILGILLSIGAPMYQKYTLKAKFTEVKLATAPYQLAIEEALLIEGAQNLEKIDSKFLGIGKASHKANSFIKSIDVQNGVITAIGNESVSEHSYILTPDLPKNDAFSMIHWEISGSCIKAGLC